MKRNEKIENVWEQLSYEKDFKLKVLAGTCGVCRSAE